MIWTRQARSHGWIFDASQGCLYQGVEAVCARTPAIKTPMAAAVKSSFFITLLDRSPEGLRYLLVRKNSASIREQQCRRPQSPVTFVPHGYQDRMRAGVQKPSR